MGYAVLLANRFLRRTFLSLPWASLEYSTANEIGTRVLVLVRLGKTRFQPVTRCPTVPNPRHVSPVT